MSVGCYPQKLRYNDDDDDDDDRGSGISRNKTITDAVGSFLLILYACQKFH